jgi:Ca-activated chloride channel family protein
MLSSVGVGTDFNEYLMTALADAGTGNYYYVQDPRELSGVFAREFDAARTTVASGLSVQIQPGPGVRVVDAAGYPIEATGDGVVIRPGSLFAGQERHIWVSLAVPQSMPGEYELGHFSLAYGEPHNRTVLAFSDVPRVASVRDANQFYANVDVSNWGRSVAVDSYNKMQQDVAREVQAGRRDEAIQRLHDFKAEMGEMNARLTGRWRSDDAATSSRLRRLRGGRPGKAVNELSKSTSACRRWPRARA